MGFTICPDGEFQKGVPMRCGEMMLKRGVEALKGRGADGVRGAAQGDSYGAQLPAQNSLPLLRPLHARLRSGFEVHVRKYPDSAGDEDRQSHAVPSLDHDRHPHRTARRIAFVGFSTAIPTGKRRSCKAKSWSFLAVQSRQPATYC